MSSYERYFATILFRNKVYELKGSAFEQFFVDIMTSANPNFRSPKPHGREGDWKNDGYDDKTGTYYQVYAPEKPNERITDAAKKLDESLEGLLDKWSDISTVKQYFFVFNDEFQGVYPEIELRLATLTEKHGIPCSLFLAKDLKKVFDGLSSDLKQDCLRCPIPDDSNSQLVSYQALNEVVKHIQSLPYNPRYIGKIPTNPGFVEKIEFNALSYKVAALLKKGEQQIGALDDYFFQDTDLKEILQQKFSAIYEEAKRIVSDEHPEHSDELFFYIFEKACPDDKRQFTGIAVEVLMSYYFAYCDIFEPPKSTLFE